MKILYGIQGTGNGHIARSRIMAKHFAEKNIKADYLFSGREADQYFDMEIFGNYRLRRGLTFVTNGGKINHLKTATQNNLFQCIRDIKQLDLTTYDLVITDFEPITAWAAKLKNKPCLAIGHQYAFGKGTPISGENPVARFIMKNFAPAHVKLGLHWHPYNETILPPIIDTTIKAAAHKQAIVVYLPFEDQSKVTELLQHFKDQRFVQYSSQLTDTELGHISLRKASHDGFKRDLCAAKGVICNTGFELISECLHLGLPILTKPVDGQMEQLSNAKALDDLNYATITRQLSHNCIQAWLDKPIIRDAINTPDVAKDIVEWILEKNLTNTKVLSDRFWHNNSPIELFI